MAENEANPGAANEEMNWDKAFKKSIMDKGYFQQVLSGLGTDEALKKTFAHYALYAAKKSKRARLLYNIFTFCSLIFPIIGTAVGWITFDITKFDPQNLSTYSGLFGIFCSILTSISTGMLATFHFKDTWDRYRWYIEGLNAIIVKTIRWSNGCDNVKAKADAPESTEEAHAENELPDDCKHMNVNAFIAEQLLALNEEHLTKWTRRKSGNDGK